MTLFLWQHMYKIDIDLHIPTEVETEGASGSRHTTKSSTQVLGKHDMYLGKVAHILSWTVKYCDSLSLEGT